MRYIWDTFTSGAYWRYVLFSSSGIRSVLFVFGAIYLFIEALDFFGIYKRDEYAAYAFIIVFLVSILISTLINRPIKSTTFTIPQKDYSVEVRIDDLFEATGAIMISTNTAFEADVAGGKISPDSIQGQFATKYFPGRQNELIDMINESLEKVDGQSPYPIGTTIPINTHGKTFYFNAMASLNEFGNASTTPELVLKALNGLWSYIREAGELQELAVPLVGTGRGRLSLPRKKMIELIVQSFVDASRDRPFSNRLVVVVRPEDARKFQVNLWDIKDHLERTIVV